MAEQATQFAVSRGAPGASSTAPFGVFERMLAMRYLRARRKEGFISVIAGFSFLGIVLGVATLIIVMAVMNGFRTELLSKILGMNGHLVLQPIDRPLDDYDALSQSIAQIDGVVHAMPYVDGQALASTRTQNSGVVVRGLTEAGLRGIAAVSDNIEQGTLDGFDTSRGSSSVPASRRCSGCRWATS